MNHNKLNDKFFYEIKFYLVSNSEVFKENHSIFFVR